LNFLRPPPQDVPPPRLVAPSEPGFFIFEQFE
jgi:hypothetical protein